MYKTTAAVLVSAHYVYQEPKIAVVVRDDLATWQRLNVTAFVVSGIAHRNPEIIGLAYEDASNAVYLPMFAVPVVVLLADRVGIRRGFRPSTLTRTRTKCVYRGSLLDRQRRRQPGGRGPSRRR
jgi:hypothetical protein